MTTAAPPLTPSLTPSLAAFTQATSDGTISDITTFCPGFSLHADPGFGVGGTWRAPSDRVLELEITTQGPGDWLALHLRLERVKDLTGAWIGFACRHAAPQQQMIRPVLRSGPGLGPNSGADDGFSDHFFAKHILSTPEPRNHLDAINLATTRTLPARARWRELVLFLPSPAPEQTLRWDLQDLRVFRL